MEFLSSPEVNIPVSGINIGPVHKKDVLRANVMNEKVGAQGEGGSRGGRGGSAARRD